MDSLIFAALGASMVAYVALGAYAAFCHRQITRLRSLHRWQSLFQAQVTKLAACNNVPKSALTTLANINAMIGQKHMPMIMFMALSGVRPSYDTSSSGSKLIAEIEDGCDEHEKERVKVLLSSAIFAGMLSLSYSDYMFGVRARALLAERMAEAPNAKNLNNASAYVRRIKERSSEKHPIFGWMQKSPLPT